MCAELQRTWRSKLAGPRGDALPGTNSTVALGFPPAGRKFRADHARYAARHRAPAWSRWRYGKDAEAAPSDRHPH